MKPDNFLKTQALVKYGRVVLCVCFVLYTVLQQCQYAKLQEHVSMCAHLCVMKPELNELPPHSDLGGPPVSIHSGYQRHKLCHFRLCLRKDETHSVTALAATAAPLR